MDLVSIRMVDVKIVRCLALAIMGIGYAAIAAVAIATVATVAKMSLGRYVVGFGLAAVFAQLPYQPVDFHLAEH